MRTTYTAMIRLTKFSLAIFVVACESMSVVLAAVNQYTRADDGLSVLAGLSLVGTGSTSSPVQCASSCNLQGSSCDGFMLESYDDDDSMRMVMCQLVKAEESLVETSAAHSDRQRLYLRSDVLANFALASVKVNKYYGQCSFPFTYSGKLYYNCTSNETLVNSYICFGVNRTNVSCDDPSYFALTVPINLMMASQPRVATMSVFGWITIQQRTPVSPEFNWARLWSEYKNGFGSIGSNFWLGLERIHQLTSSSKYRLRIEMQAASNGTWYSVEYWSFVIGDETATKYQLNVTGYSGDGGNGLQDTKYNSWLQNESPFSTSDSDNDQAPSNCAARFGGGFWYKNCKRACLTCSSVETDWRAIPVAADFILAQTRMMIKPQ